MRRRHYEAAVLPAAPGPGSATVYHATEHLLPYLRCPTVMTVHDLIFEARRVKF